jgi:Ca2+-binding EF-hand superfamily protein
LWNQFDVDKNNALDRDEALIFVKKVSENMVDKTRRQNFSEANFHKIFSDFDEDHNGFLVQAEMAVLIK